MAENVFAVSQGGIDRPVTVDVVDRRALIGEQAARPRPLRRAGERAAYCRPGGRCPTCACACWMSSAGELPERHVGEIALRSDCMLSGYYNRPDLTERAFYDGWYLTGDLGYLAEGELYVTGRKKDLIIVGGKNVHPQDLEALAGEVPGVHPGRVVAFGVFDDELGTEDVVVVAEADSASRGRKTSGRPGRRDAPAHQPRLGHLCAPGAHRRRALGAQDQQRQGGARRQPGEISGRAAWARPSTPRRPG